MLQATDRTTFIDALRPPIGHRFDAAAAVTFTLDLRAMLAAPAALALESSRTGSDGDVDDRAQPVEVLHALRAHARHVTVFAQAGEIAVPPARKVFGFLDHCVVPVEAPRGGVVHPKVWLLAFAPLDDGPRRLRLLVSSRNLTFDDSWDTLVRLDEAATGSGDPMEPVADLFEGLLAQAVGAVDPEHAERVRSLAAELRTRSFACPPGVAGMRAHAIGLGTPFDGFPAERDRCIVVSPFLTAGFFGSTLPGVVETVVSRPTALDAIASVANVGDLYCFDDGTTSEDPDVVGPARPMHGLHAKIFGFEAGERARWFVGSANATTAAFSSNVEFLVEFEGDRASLGFDAMLGDPDDTENVGMWRMFLPYTPGVGDGADEVDDPLADLRRQVARSGFVATARAHGDGWRIEYRTLREVHLPAGTTLTIWPLPVPGARRTVECGGPVSATFDVTLDGVTGFIGCELSDGEVTSTFCVPAFLEQVPEDRDAALMRSLIDSAERFFAYLLAMLGDVGIEDVLADVAGHDWEAPEWDRGSLDATPVLERMLLAMRRDPARLLDIGPLVDGLSRDGVLPEEFARLWASVVSAAER